MKRTIITGLALTTLLVLFTLPLTASAQKGIPYDYVVQNDSGCPVVMFNSKTGQYLFSDDEGLLLAGVGKIGGTSIAPRLSFKNGVYTCVTTVDAIAKTATGYVFDNLEGEIEYTMNDSNITDNTGRCDVAQ